MISGAFNLNNANNKNRKLFYKKTGWKILIPTAGIIVIFLPFAIIKKIFAGDLWFEPIISVFQGAFKIWFMFMLLGLYILTPFIIKAKEVLTKKERKRSIIVLCIWAILSQATSSYKLSYSIGVVGSFLAYYLLGDYLYNEIKISLSRGLLIAISLIMIFATFIVRFWGFEYYLSDAYTNFFSPTIFVYSISVFMFVKGVNSKISWYRVSKYTFYIYLFHMFVLAFITKILGKYMRNIMNIKAIIFEIVITFIASFICAIIYDKFWASKEKWKEKFYSLSLFK